MTVILNKEHWTTKDLEELPDIPGTRYEIIDGELIVSTAPHLNHQRVLDRLNGLFSFWDFDNNFGIAVSGPGIIFNDDNNAIPDLAWISNQRINTSSTEGGKFHVSPELAVEAVSPGSANENRDRENKLGLYSRRGISEYWIINWQTRELEIYRRQTESGLLQLTRTLSGDDELNSPLLPGFNYPVSIIFRNLFQD